MSSFWEARKKQFSEYAGLLPKPLTIAAPGRIEDFQ